MMIILGAIMISAGPEMHGGKNEMLNISQSFQAQIAPFISSKPCLYFLMRIPDKLIRSVWQLKHSCMAFPIMFLNL